MTRRAIIVGSRGQDGTLLREHLASRGYAVIGVHRSGIDGDAGEWARRQVNIADAQAVARLVADTTPEEIYFLAAYHHSSEERQDDEMELFRKSTEIHLIALVVFLEAMRQHSPGSRLFFAASSHIFGAESGGRQDESTPLRPQTVYGITKAAGLLACRRYRNVHGIFASTGILYNHESPLRSTKFVSKKIAAGVAAIKRGVVDKIVLGDLGASADWGYAPDYVDAMHHMLQLPQGDDFVVATGEAHTVQEFAEIAFDCAGLSWKDHVQADAGLMARKMPGFLGDASKFMAASGWRPSVSFREMVRRLVKHELEQPHGQ